MKLRIFHLEHAGRRYFDKPLDHAQSMSRVCSNLAVDAILSASPVRANAKGYAVEAVFWRAVVAVWLAMFEGGVRFSHMARP
jgi:hypothetical protein